MAPVARTFNISTGRRRETLTSLSWSWTYSHNVQSCRIAFAQRAVPSLQCSWDSERAILPSHGGRSVLTRSRCSLLSPLCPPPPPGPGGTSSLLCSHTQGQQVLPVSNLGSCLSSCSSSPSLFIYLFIYSIHIPPDFTFSELQRYFL